MHSEKSSNVQKTDRRSFIEAARRTQIIDAAIDAIASLGYMQASLAKIAEHANISTSLILYHFKDKDELTATVLETIIGEWEMATELGMKDSHSVAEKLRSYIEARLIYIGTNPKKCIALVDLLFIARSNNMQRYRTTEKGFELDAVTALLKEGQEKGEFKDFDAGRMGILIRSTIDQFLGYSQDPSIELEAYIKDLTAWIGILVSKKGTI